MEYNFSNLETDINNKIDFGLARFLLNNSDLRYYFISNYSFFNIDGNIELYKTFINSNIKSKDNYLVSETIDLAIIINYNKIYESVKKIVLSKNHYLVKISCLDYLNHFYNSKKNKKEYIDLNKLIKSKSSNKIVLFQVYINLLKWKKGFYSKIILNFLDKNKEPFYLYRITNNLSQFEYFQSVKDVPEFIEQIILLIESNKLINIDDKKYLVSQMHGNG